ncbi:histidine phosphatase family protein, partial [Nonomuraea maheshkhaliensis]|uniref:histidine phosphatase family protein n=1 Tax=Nonomuraea maheshkhaliensis TaxID=419590 RepID=UPI0031FA4793
ALAVGAPTARAGDATEAPTRDATGGATVVVFTHGGPIRVGAAAALRLPVPGHLSFAPPVNTSLTVIGYAGERQDHAVVEYNAPTTWAAQAARAD